MACRSSRDGPGDPGPDAGRDPARRTRVCDDAAVKTFDELFAELSGKAATRPAGSGTVAALDAGVHAIGKKVVEEAAEVWMAAEHESARAAPPRKSPSCSTTCRSSCSREGSRLDDVYAHL